MSESVFSITPISRCCHIIVLNVHFPSVNKENDSKDTFYEGTE